MRFDDHDLACLRRGLEHFRAGDYFAAHDDWEEVWQGLRGRQRLFWQAMIQLVVGMYHYTNRNLRGCRMRAKSQKGEDEESACWLPASAINQRLHPVTPPANALR